MFDCFLVINILVWQSTYQEAICSRPSKQYFTKSLIVQGSNSRSLAS